MRDRFLLFWCFGLGYFISNFLRAANAVIAPDLRADLGLSGADLGVMTSLFYVGFAAVQLPLGGALDRYGTRTTMPLLMLFAAVGALIFAGAQDFAQAALGRTLIGIGMAGGLMGLLKAFGIWFGPQRYPILSSVMVSLGASGGLVAASPLAWANAQVGWRAVFVGCAVFVAVSAALIALLTRNAPAGATWQQPGTTRGGFGQIFRSAAFWRIGPMNFFLIGSLLALQTLWGAPFLIEVYGYSTAEAAAQLLLLSSGLALGYLASGPMATWRGNRGSFAVVAPIFVGCLVLLGQPLVQWPPYIIGTLYAALGFTGAFNLVLLTDIRQQFPQHMSGRAATTVNMCGFGGAALLQSLFGVVLSAAGRDATGNYLPAGYSVALLALALGTGVAGWRYVRVPATIPDL